MKIGMLLVSLFFGTSTGWATMISDDFNRADQGSSIDGSLIGQNWVNSDGSDRWAISSGSLRAVVVTPSAVLYNSELETGSSSIGRSFTLSADVSGKAPNAWSGVVFNYQNSTNFYVLRFKAGTTSYQLNRVVNGITGGPVFASDAITTFAEDVFYTLTVSSTAAYEFNFTITEVGSSTVLNPTTTAIDGNNNFTDGYAGIYNDGVTGWAGAYDNFSLEVIPDTAAGLLFELIAEAPAQPDYTILDETGVQSVCSSVRVNFALLTESNRQFVGFYDANKQLVIAQRTLDSDVWTFKKLNSFLEWDSHNYIDMALDAEGYLHVSGNMHVVPLVYFRSTNSYDVASLQQVVGMVGNRELEVTYPKFLKNSAGELIFTYRDGHSGDGDQIYNIYNTTNQTWSRLIDTPLADGEGLRNAYFVGPEMGPDGWFHMTWIWRDTYDAETSHDLSYARSLDLVNWVTAAGTPITLPFLLGSPGVIVDPVPVQGGMINGNGKIGFDLQNRVILSYHKFDENGNTQFYNARWENGAWAIHRTTNWDYRWYFSGGGTLTGEIGMGTVTIENGQLRQSYWHIVEGSGEFILDETTLWATGYLRQRQWPSEIRNVRSTFPEMQVKLQRDINLDSGYILRWETLPNNLDQPRDPPWPDLSLLQVYKVQ